MNTHIEPWKIKNDRQIVNSDNTVLAEFPVDYEEDAARAVECVNALTGVEDPSKVKKIIDAIREDVTGDVILDIVRELYDFVN